MRLIPNTLSLLPISCYNTDKNMPYYIRRGNKKMDTREAEIKKAAEAAIEEHPEKRVLSFSWDGETFWIKRKMGNGRKAAVKYSVEKEFYYEIARMTIAARSTPELVAPIEVLTPTYMVTVDGGANLTHWLESDISEEKKISILEQAGAALASLHGAGIVHGRPALRDICWKDGKITFLDWENRLYSQDLEEQKAIDFLIFLQGLARENFAEGKSRLAAMDRGYRNHGGEAARQEALRFLDRHKLLQAIIKQLSVFHMVDVESVQRVIEYLKGSE